MSVTSAAAASSAIASQDVQSQVAIKMIKIGREQQKQMASLVEDAAQLASQIQSRDPNLGKLVDVRA